MCWIKEDKKEPRDTTNFYQIKTFKQHQPMNQSVNQSITKWISIWRNEWRFRRDICRGMRSLICL